MAFDLATFLLLYAPLFLLGLAAAHQSYRGYLLGKLLGSMAGGRVAVGGCSLWIDWNNGLNLLLSDLFMSLKQQPSLTFKHVRVSAWLVP